MTLRKEFDRKFEVMCKDVSNSELFAVSRRRLKLDENPSVHGVLYLEIRNMKHAVPHEELPELTGFSHRQMDEADPLMATLGYVAPGFLSQKDIHQLWAGMDSSYHPTAPLEWWKTTCELAVHYGTAVHAQWKFFLDTEDMPWLQWALNEKMPMESLCGFYIDKQVNACGDTGWDWLKGDIGAGARRQAQEVRK